MTLDELNRTEPPAAADVLETCCGSRKWADGMAARRPFCALAELHDAADCIWASLSREDWLEAFGSHPKIGETSGASRWSKQEQAGVAIAAEDVRTRIARLNHEYKAQFGFIFIICATGKSAEEMLISLEQRLVNSPEHEIRLAAEEQQKIIHLRLDKLINR
ncbi:MAG: 2-oxo-4-hydroxy-4-carboxy-5-ureidoimidazoline decarboxylase [Bryobacteraceae bacterium]